MFKKRWLKPGSGSSNFSLNLGNVGLSDSGYFKNILYNNNTAFFRTYGLFDES